MNNEKTHRTPFKERFKTCYLDYTDERLWEYSYLKVTNR